MTGDSDWLFQVQSGDAWFINVNGQGNVVSSFADCNNREGPVATSTFTKVRIALGNVLGSTFVIVNGTDTTFQMS